MNTKKLYSKLFASIKRNEGFRGESYLDSLGNPTIGYGTKLPLTKKEGELLLNNRLSEAINLVQFKLPFVKQLPQVIQEVIYEMAYQLGIGTLLEFTNTLKAAQNRDYEEMIKEMRDSKWYEKTPSRVNSLVSRIEEYINENKSV